MQGAERRPATRPVPMALRLLLVWLGLLLAVPVGPAAAAAVAPAGQAPSPVSAAGGGHAVPRAAPGRSVPGRAGLGRSDAAAPDVLRCGHPGKRQSAQHGAKAALPAGAPLAHRLACAPAPAAAAPAAAATPDVAQERGRGPPAAGASRTAGVQLPLPA